MMSFTKRQNRTGTDRTKCAVIQRTWTKETGHQQRILLCVGITISGRGKTGGLLLTTAHTLTHTHGRMGSPQAQTRPRNKQAGKARRSSTAQPADGEVHFSGGEPHRHGTGTLR